EHMSDNFRKTMRKGISQIDELEKAFAGTGAKFIKQEEILGEDETGKVISRINSIKASFTNAKGQIQDVTFELNKLANANGKDFDYAWFPSNISKTVDTQMRDIENAIS